MMNLQKESWRQFRTVAGDIATTLFVAVVAVGLFIFLMAEHGPSRAYLMTYFIEHEESGAMYKISRRVYKSRDTCNASTAVLNNNRPTVWMEDVLDAFILNYARCSLVPELMDREARERLNEELALQFIGG